MKNPRSCISLPVVFALFFLLSCGPSSQSNSSAGYKASSSSYKTYEHRLPAFTIDYPKNYILAKSSDPHAVLSLKEPNNWINLSFHVAVGEVVKSSSLADCPESWIEQSKKKYRDRSDYQIISTEIISLANGTKACEAVIEFQQAPDSAMQVSYLYALKDKHWVEVCYFADTSAVTGLLEGITHTLKFQ